MSVGAVSHVPAQNGRVLSPSKKQQEMDRRKKLEELEKKLTKLEEEERAFKTQPRGIYYDANYSYYQTIKEQASKLSSTSVTDPAVKIKLIQVIDEISRTALTKNPLTDQDFACLRIRPVELIDFLRRLKKIDKELADYDESLHILELRKKDILADIMKLDKHHPLVLPGQPSQSSAVNSTPPVIRRITFLSSIKNCFLKTLKVVKTCFEKIFC